MRVAKWGNSLAVRLPSKLVRAMSLEDGDDVHLEIIDAESRVVSIAKGAHRQQLVEGLKQYEGRLPADFRFDRGEANER